MTKAKTLVGRTLGRLLGLPPHTSAFDVIRGVPVPMRDHVDLLADHYRPLTPKPAGTLLVRTPYGRGYPVSALFGSIYAARGYHVVVQSVRGTYGSAGDFSPFTNEIADGADTVAWLREQPWFTGSFGTMGASYLGRNVSVLATEGRLVVIGMQGGTKGELDLSVLLRKRGAIIATTLRARPAEEKAAICASVVEHVWPLVADRKVRELVDTTLPLDDVRRAHELMESGRHSGKILLRMA